MIKRCTLDQDLGYPRGAPTLVSKPTTVQIELVCCGKMWYNKGAP